MLVAISVGLDNLAAAAAMAAAGVPRSHFARVVAVFGLFEAGMPVVGILLGRAAAGGIGSATRVLAGVLLCAVGLYSLGRALRRDASSGPVLTSRPHHLVALAAVLSADNFAVGFALGADRVPIVAAFLALGIVSAALTLVGLELGARVGRRAGRSGEAIGALILVGVGVAIAAGA